MRTMKEPISVRRARRPQRHARHHVQVGREVVTAEAVRTENAGRKHIVEVRAVVGDREVLRGTFTAFVLDKHVLD